MNITILSAIAIVFLPSHPILASNSLISAQNNGQQQDTSVTNEVRSHIRAEVQQTFHATFTVLSLLLVLLLLLPTITAIAAWFLLAKLAQKSALAQQEIESLNRDVLSQLETLLNDAKAVLLTAQLPPVIAEDIFPETNGHSQVLQLDLGQILSQALEPDLEQGIEENLESNLAQADCNQAKLSGDSPSDLPSESVQLNPAQPELSKLARDYILQAEKFFLSNQLEAAIDAYNQAIKFDPNSAETWNNRGVVLIKLQRYHEAVASYEQAIQRRTGYADAWNNRGVALGKLQHYEPAIASYEQAIQIKSNYVDAWNNKGFALTQLEYYEEAICAYQEAIRLDSDFYWAWYNQARCYGRQGQFDSAIASLQQAMKLNPKTTQNLAIKETDFLMLYQDERFQKIIGETFSLEKN